MDNWDEKRIDVIGSNGNSGLHYEKLSDVSDIASNLEQIACDKAIKYAQEKANKLEIQPIGHCLFCGEKFLTDSIMRWCDSFCRNSWEREKLNKR